MFKFLVLFLATAAAALPSHGKPPRFPTNSPSDRQAWSGGFDIHTDYELSWPTTGRVVEYDFVITNEVIAPDGYEKTAMLVNGQYPGPPIIANWGDWVRVRVTNNLSNNNGTTIHWHGLRQYLTNAQDGVPGVTQCPIAPGTSQVYEFQATQYGTSWYHSHLSLQYPDGIVGGIQINGPTSKNYDQDLGLFLMTDWVHADAFSVGFQDFQGRLPNTDSVLFNGKGHYNCSTTDPLCVPDEQSYEEVHFTHGTTYKMHLVNTGIDTQFTFWIDNHTFTVVGMDFVAIKPYVTDTINLGAGQRYEIIVKADANIKKNTNFWMNMRQCTTGQPFGPPPPAAAATKRQGPGPGPGGGGGGGPPPAPPSTLGIIRYGGGHALPTTYNDTRTTFGCADPVAANLVPIVPRQVAADTHSYETLRAGLYAYPNQTDTNSSLVSWALGDMSLKLDWSEPTLKLADDGSISHLPGSYVPIYLDNENEWVYFLILDNFSTQPLVKTGPQVEHPIHLHGHDFAILAQSNTTFDASTLELNLNNPPRRDVAVLPAGGYMLIAFETNNPGVWLMHCHIAWHASTGMGLQFIEAKHKIKPMLDRSGMGFQVDNQCKKWDKYYKHDPSKQDDSGI